MDILAISMIFLIIHFGQFFFTFCQYDKLYILADFLCSSRALNLCSIVLTKGNLWERIYNGCNYIPTFVLERSLVF